MKNKYMKPTYEVELIESADVITASTDIEDAGEATVGSITGDKGIFSSWFDSIL